MCAHAHAGRPPAAQREGIQRETRGKRAGGGGRGASPRVLLTSQRRVLPKGVLVQRVPLLAQGSVLLATNFRKRLRSAVLVITFNLRKDALQAEQEGCGGGEGPALRALLASSMPWG